jgi:transposase-like protein
MAGPIPRMGRKSRLTEEQWTELGRRLLEGEPIASLAREYNVGDSTIRSRFVRRGQKTQTIQQVASQLYDAEQAAKLAERNLKQLPAAAQYAAITLSQRMRNISDKLAEAAEYSTSTAMRYAALANGEALKVDDADPMKAKSLEALKSSMVLTKAANEAAELPTKILSAAGNRDLITRINDDRTPAAGGDVLTPERIKEGVRRMAFTLQRAALPENANG